MKVIIRDPLRKPINSGKLNEKGLDNERVRNQKIRVSVRETKSSLIQED